MMNFWFVSIFENTPVDDNQNTRYNSMAKEAHKRGHSVTFWASTFKHNVKEQRYKKDTTVQIEEGFRLQFVRSKAYEKNLSFRRMLSHRDFGKRVVEAFEQADEKPDIIMLAFPPVSSADYVSSWAKDQGIPCVIDIIDPWPDVFKSHIPFIPDFVLDILFIPLQNSVKKTIRRATAVTAISNQYLSWANSYVPGLKQTKYFYPAVQFEQMQKELKQASGKIEKSDDSFHIIYAGSLGYSYDIPTILETAAILEAEHGNEIRFTVAGDGPQKKIVEQYQNVHKNLSYVGRVPKDKLMEYYYLSDMGMTQHVKGATQSVTYKLFDLLACGLPILNSLESEMKDIILENNVGLHNNPGDAVKLAENITFCYKNRWELGLMKKNAIRLTKQLGDSQKVYAEAIDFLESLQKN